MRFAPERRRALFDVALAATGLFYAGLLAVLSFEYSFEARIFALVAASASLITGAVYLVVSVRQSLLAPREPASSPSETDRGGEERAQLALLTMLVLASVAFLYLCGVYAYSFAFTVAFLRVFAGRSWPTVLGLATGLTVFNYVMFALLFDLRFDAVGVLLRAVR
jgi:hypothetical protein